jgi:hypothetical protein
MPPSRGLSVCIRELDSHLFIILWTAHDKSIFYFVDLVKSPGYLDIYSFWNTFIYVSKLLLSSLFFGGFIPSGTFYASMISYWPLVF